MLEMQHRRSRCAALRRAAFVICPSCAAAYPTIVACSRELVVGTTMMGQAAEADTYRTVEFQRDGVAVACGGAHEAAG